MEKIPSQHPSDCLKIVLFGPESTGKSTLAAQLATHFQEQWVPEFMRQFLEAKWEKENKMISKEDLVPIALGQIQSEKKATVASKKYLFCDTNPLQLKVYCDYYYPEGYPETIRALANKGLYHHYFLTDIDVPWEPDILRDRPYDRSTLFRMFEAELQKRKLPYTLLSGNKEDRFAKALETLEQLEKK